MVFLPLELINYFNYFSTVVSSNSCVILSCRPFFFKSLIMVIVGFQNFVCCLACAVDLWVQITGEGRSLHIGSFCPAITSLSRFLEEAAFGISISSNVFIFLWLFSKVYYGHSFFCCFHFMSLVKDMFREFGFASCVSEDFYVFSKSCVESLVSCSHISILQGFLEGSVGLVTVSSAMRVISQQWHFPMLHYKYNPKKITCLWKIFLLLQIYLLSTFHHFISKNLKIKII